MIRRPVVAGQFYTGDARELRAQVAGFMRMDSRFRGNDMQVDALGVMSPHAGYVYSGRVAGEALSSIKPKSTYILLGTNHTGYGKPFGMDAERNWKTPLGEVKVDKELARGILDNSRYVEKDHLCHDFEHSIEVQLPFLQYLNKDFSFVPIVIAHADKETYRAIGKELAQAVKDLKKDVTFIASSDMTHYEPHEPAKKKDMLAIEKILALDIGGFLDTVAKHDISMCGSAPTAVMMRASIESGAKKAKLIKYETSGDTSGNYSAVVGYAGIVIY